MAIYIYESEFFKVFSGTAVNGVITNIDFHADDICFNIHTPDGLVDFEELGAQTKMLLEELRNKLEDIKQRLGSKLYTVVVTEYFKISAELISKLKEAVEQE